MGMLGYIFAAAANVFFLALRITLAVLWVVGALIFSLTARLLRREPEERTRQLQGSIEGWQVLSPVRCPQCSTLNEQTLSACYRCGTPLPETEATTRTRMTAEWPWLWMLLTVVVLFVIVVAIA